MNLTLHCATMWLVLKSVSRSSTLDVPRRYSFHHLLHPQVIAKEHERIRHTIKAGDPDRAAAEMDVHLSRARKKLVASLQEEPAALASARFAKSPFGRRAGRTRYFEPHYVNSCTCGVQETQAGL